MRFPRITPSSWWLALVVLAVLLAAPTAQARPEYCWDICTASTPCDTLCYDFETTTCGASEYPCYSGGGGTCSCSNYVYGTSAGDTLNGTSYNDCISGGAGDDTLYGHAGGDNLYGDDGNDTLYGGSGDDCLFGGAGWDHLDGETGNDTCTEGETYVSC